MSERVGDWMQLYSGRRFWPLDPRVEDIAIEDIAHALSLICRYQGHSRRFYSVAEHSLLMCRAATERRPLDRAEQLQALLHDAAEAYLCDVIRPVKRSIVGYQEAEHRIERVIQERFGLLAPGKTPFVDALDNAILYDEARALMRVDLEPWHEQFHPGIGLAILGLSPVDAEAAFLEAFSARHHQSERGANA